MNRKERVIRMLQKNGVVSVGMQMAEVASATRWGLVPAVTSWLVYGVVYGLGYHLVAVVLLGIGLTLATFTLTTRFLEQLLRLVGSNSYLVMMASAEQDILDERDAEANP